MEKQDLKNMKLELAINAKSGIDFILSAGIVWLAIYFIWTLNISSYDKSVFTFMVGSILLPLAFGLSKILKTNWRVKNNPLQPLGLWLNFAQLIYFPILIFILIKFPDYFIMTYAIITGAHLFPYAWFYDELGYAVTAIILSVGSLLLTMKMEPEMMWAVPLFTSVTFFLFAVWLFMKSKRIVNGSIGFDTSNATN
jgi:hypothetical protein